MTLEQAMTKLRERFPDTYVSIEGPCLVWYSTQKEPQRYKAWPVRVWIGEHGRYYEGATLEVAVEAALKGE